MDHERKNMGELRPGEATPLTSLVEYAGGAVVSRTLRKCAGGTLTAFAFDDGQELSEHSAPFAAYVQVIEGTVRLTIGGQAVDAKAGEVVLMPANVPHAVRATSRLKMLLTMLKDAT